MSSVKGSGVGVAICVFKNKQILLGKRKKKPGKNSWQCPGGWLNQNESVFECAQRLVKYKTGLKIQQLNYGPYTNNRFNEDDIHSVSLYVSAEYLSGEIDSRHYLQADDWQWFDLDKLPSPLFLPLQLLQKKHNQWLSSGED